MSSEAFYKTLIGIIIKSDKTIEEKVSLLVSLQNDQKEKEISLIEKEIALIQKEKEIALIQGEKEIALIKLENKEVLFQEQTY